MSISSMAMALSPCSVSTHSIPTNNPAVFIANRNNRKLHRILKFDSVKTKKYQRPVQPYHSLPPRVGDKEVNIQATGDKETKPKTKSVLCTDCDGNGAVQCSQCKGSGINLEDFFNGQFKAGDSCWLCGGRKEMLCGNCNGAGFVGGFMSGLDH